MLNARTLSLSFATALALSLGACGGGSSDTPAPVVASAPPPVNPTAAFTAPATANANAAIAFDASSSSSTDGSALQYVWDFGNGQRGGGKTIAHLFNSGGAKSVTLTVIDGANRSATATHTVTIGAAPVATASVIAQGMVKALDGTALGGVTVTIVGGSASAVSDSMGQLNLTLGAGIPVVLKLSKTGYSDQFLPLNVPTTAGADAYFDVAMRPRDAAMTLADAAAGGTLTGRDGAVITLPAAALVNGAGTAVSGAVQIAVTPVDVTQAAAGGFPGRFDGAKNDGTMSPIVSLGVAEYVLSASGQSLQLAPGKSATIEIPIYAAKRLDGSVVAAGDSIPLWSLDEATGVWVQEGTGTVVVSVASPSGFAMRATVTHFSWWNSDLGFDPYGPQPQCVYDMDSGIPGGNDTFASATICNMLAEIDRGLDASGTRVRSMAGASALSPVVAGFSRRYVVPIAGGQSLAVPANVNIKLTALALNGTWGGTAVVNGAIGVQAPVIIKMRPLFTLAGPTPEAITLPFDATRSLPAQPTALFTFTGAPFKYASVTLTPTNGSVLTGRLRLLQGSTVLGTATIPNGSARILVPLPGAGTYTIEVVGDSPAGFRLQAELLGGLQTEAIALPLDITRALPAYTLFHGTLEVTTPVSVYLAARATNGVASAVKLSAPDGTVLYSGTAANAASGTSLTLTALGTYVLEIAPQTTSDTSFRATIDQTLWTQVAPQIDVAGVYQMIDLVADRNGKLVVGYTTPLAHDGRSSDVVRLRRWTGSAWESVGDDLTIDRPCNGPLASFAFDSSNSPVLVYGNTTAGASSFVSVKRYSAGAWTALGPNDGTLPMTSTYTGACGSLPRIAIGADDAPIAAYEYDNDIVVQRFSGTTWQGLAAPATGDVFALQNGTYDIQVDTAGRVWFVTDAPVFSGIPARVRRFNTTTLTWDGVGPNGGALQEVGTQGLLTPRLRFDAGGLPVIGWVAGVGGGGVASPGVAVYRYDGATWSTTGGYETGPNNFLQMGLNDFGFALFNGDAIAAWTNSDRVASTSTAVVQRNTAAGWSAVGAGNGELPQFAQHGITNSVAYSSRLVNVGSELYLALIAVSQAGDPSFGIKLTLLHKVP